MDPNQNDDLIEDVITGLGSVADIRDRQYRWIRRGIATSINGVADIAEGAIGDVRSQLDEALSPVVTSRNDGVLEARLGIARELARVDSELAQLLGREPTLAEDDGGPPIVPVPPIDPGQPPPPPGGGPCTFFQAIPPTFDSPCAIPVWDDALGTFVLASVEIPAGVGPSYCFRVPSQYWYNNGQGDILASIPPDEWPRDIVELVFSATDALGRVCRFTARVVFIQPPPPPFPPQPISGIITPPIIPTQPPPPPPPPEVPTAPPIGVPGVILPPGCVPRDPCYPQPWSCISQGVYTADPLPLVYWARARCVDPCRAEVECCSGDCPPAPEPGWHYYGPWSGCPTYADIQAIIRACLGTGGPGDEPPAPTLPIAPPWVEPPPLPPPPVPEPPDPKDCPPITTHPPQWDAELPFCVDEASYFDALYREAQEHRSLAQLATTIAERMPDEVEEDYMAPWR